MTYYVEWCSNLFTRKGNMVTLDTLKALCSTYSRDTGYRSCYMFKEDYAKEIKLRGSSKGMVQYPVASDKLFIDLDDGDSSLEEVENLLKSKGYKYSVWFSGSKGYHIYLYHELIEDINLPFSHRKFIEELGIKCDLSLYQHGRIFSLPGRKHPKTGKQKVFLRGVKGKNIEFPIVEPPERPDFNFEGLSERDEVLDGLFKLIDITAKQPYCGMRHMHIFGISKDLKRAGFSINTTIDIMQTINSLWAEPKTEDEVVLAVEGGYKC